MDQRSVKIRDLETLEKRLNNELKKRWINKEGRKATNKGISRKPKEIREKEQYRDNVFSR